MDEKYYSDAVCLERRNRIRLSVAAHTYEELNESIMSDFEYDQLSYKIDPSVDTGNEELDKFFFVKNFPHAQDNGFTTTQTPEAYGLFIKRFGSQ